MFPPFWIYATATARARFFVMYWSPPAPSPPPHDPTPAIDTARELAALPAGFTPTHLACAGCRFSHDRVSLKAPGLTPAKVRAWFTRHKECGPVFPVRQRSAA